MEATTIGTVGTGWAARPGAPAGGPGARGARGRRAPAPRPWVAFGGEARCRTLVAHLTEVDAIVARNAPPASS
jgi:hypothetical protein